MIDDKNCTQNLIETNFKYFYIYEKKNIFYVPKRKLYMQDFGFAILVKKKKKKKRGIMTLLE